MPVEKRAIAGAWTSARRTGAPLRAVRDDADRFCGFSSTSVFQSPHPGQRPCHFGLSCPQAEQLKTVRGGIRPR
jgi:hypothetical protein